MAILFEMTEEFKDTLESNFGVVFEGSYSEGTKFGSTELAREYDKLLKEAKQLEKDGKYKESIKYFKKCNSMIPKLKSEAEKIPDDKAFDTFMGIAGGSLSSKYKNKEKGTRSYYRTYWKDYINGMKQYNDNRIEQLEDKIKNGVKESFDYSVDSEFDL